MLTDENDLIERGKANSLVFRQQYDVLPGTHLNAWTELEIKREMRPEIIDVRRTMKYVLRGFRRPTCLQYFPMMSGCQPVLEVFSLDLNQLRSPRQHPPRSTS